MSGDSIDRATNEFLAEELRADAKAVEQAEEVAAAANPPSPEAVAAPVAVEPAPETVKVSPAQMKKLATVLLKVCDRIIVSQAGKAYALTAEEQSDIADAAVPVLEKHLPGALGWFVTSPEGALILTAGIIYGTKAGIDVMGLASQLEAPPDEKKTEPQPTEKTSAKA